MSKFKVGELIINNKPYKSESPCEVVEVDEKKKEYKCVRMMFQFQHGTIKTLELSVKDLLQATFQFQHGTIKTPDISIYKILKNSKLKL